jgi:hypothetical protein
MLGRVVTVLMGYSRLYICSLLLDIEMVEEKATEGKDKGR